MTLLQALGKSGLRPFLAVLLLLVGGTIESVYAQSNGAAASAQGGLTTGELFKDAKDKVDDFDQFDWPPKGRFTLSPRLTDTYVEFNRRLWNKHGILYVFMPTIMMQKGTQGGNQDFTANEQYQSFFAWRLLNKTPIGTGYFFFNNLHVSQLTRTSGVDFSKSLGINYFTSDSTSNVEVIKALLWYQELPGDFLTLWLGHDEMAQLDMECRYACDDTGSFFSSPLSQNPTRTMPGMGPSARIDLKLAKGVALETAVADAEGNGKLNFNRVFENGRLTYASSLKIENAFASVGDGLFKFTYYEVDSTGTPGTTSFQKASQGVSIMVDQDFGDVGIFAKYAKAFERKSAIEQYASAGVVWTKPFGNDEDWLGVGFGWVDPTAPNTNNEYVAETFYRLQLTPFVQVSPGAMLIMNPTSNPDAKREGVFSLRARALY